MRAPRPAFSKLRAHLRVGADFFARAGALRADLPAPPGLVDALSDLARPGLDVNLIDPAVGAFFLAPGTLRLRVQSRWHGAFSLLWWAMRPVLGAVGQLHLPSSRAEVLVKTLALEPARDGRPDVRGVLRSYADGAIMQVMAYATHRWGDAGYMSAAFPMPLGALCGVLRLDLLEGGGARLTTRARAGSGEPVGLWFAPLRGPAIPLPLEETLQLWPAISPYAPAELRGGARHDDTFVGLHEQRLCGLRFATHAYWFSPLV